MVERAAPDGWFGMDGLKMGGGSSLRFIWVGRGLLIYEWGHLYVLIILSWLDNFWISMLLTLNRLRECLNITCLELIGSRNFLLETAKLCHLIWMFDFLNTLWAESWCQELTLCWRAKLLERPQGGRIRAVKVWQITGSGHPLNRYGPSKTRCFTRHGLAGRAIIIIVFLWRKGHSSYRLDFFRLNLRSLVLFSLLEKAVTQLWIRF